LIWFPEPDTDEDILKRMDIKVIEKFLRKEKFKRINK